jgi:hypothetical protein
MTKNAIVNKVSGTFSKVGFQLKKHSPEILVTAGVIGAVGSAVLACRATLKVNDILDETKTSIDKIHVATEKGVTEGGQSYNEQDSKKDLTLVYAQTGVKLAKLYGPSLILGGLSLTSILASHKIMRTRNAALAAAYATVDTAFKGYRGNVIERFGEKVDRELKYNIKTEEVEETVVNEKGKEKKVKKTVETVDSTRPIYSAYAVVFDETNPCWEKDAEYNKTFLILKQNYWNDVLHVKKRVFLNEILKDIGFEPTKAGQVVGWKLDGNGDGYIDFGILDPKNKQASMFVIGYERSIILDFNVDGNVWEDM